MKIYAFDIQVENNWKKILLIVFYTCIKFVELFSLPK